MVWESSSTPTTAKRWPSETEIWRGGPFSRWLLRVLAVEWRFYGEMSFRIHGAIACDALFATLLSSFVLAFLRAAYVSWYPEQVSFGIRRPWGTSSIIIFQR